MAAAFAAACPPAIDRLRRSTLALIAVLATLVGASPAFADEVPVSENASRRFSEGVRYLTSEAPDRFHKAYREFKAAYADSPTWKILGNLGIVAQELERDGEAIDAFSQYLKEGGKRIPRDERKQVARDLDLVRSGHATLRLEIGPVAAWVVDERLPESGDPVVNRYGPVQGPLTLRIRAGHHRVVAERSGYVESRWETQLRPGESRDHEFQLVKPSDGDDPAPRGPASPSLRERDERPPDGVSGTRVGAFISFGVAAVGAGAGAWFLHQASEAGTRANQRHAACVAGNTPEQGDRCQDTNENFPAALEADEDEQSARTRSLVSFGVAGAALITGGILLLVSSGDDADDDQAALTPWIGPGMAGLRGTF